MHPERQGVGVLQQPFTLGGKLFPDRVVGRNVLQDLEPPEQLHPLMHRQGRRRGAPVVARKPLVSQDAAGLGEMPQNVRVALERGRALERLEGLWIVPPRLIRVGHRVIRVEIRRVERQRACAHRQAFVVVARLLEEESEHGHELRLVGVQVEAVPGDPDAAFVVPPGDAIEPDAPDHQAIQGVALGRVLEQRLRLFAVTPLQGVDGLHVQALALVGRMVGQGHDLSVGRGRHRDLPHAPGDEGPRTVSENEARIRLHGGIQRIHRAAAPAKKEIEPALVRGQGLGRRRGNRQSLEIAICHEPSSRGCVCVIVAPCRRPPQSSPNAEDGAKPSAADR